MWFSPAQGCLGLPTAHQNQVAKTRRALNWGGGEGEVVAKIQPPCLSFKTLHLQRLWLRNRNPPFQPMPACSQPELLSRG